METTKTSSMLQVEQMLNGAQQREPVLLGTAVVQFIIACIALGASFGFDMTPEQSQAFWTFAGSVSLLIWMGAAALRQRMDSPATVEKKVVEALYTPVPTSDASAPTE